MGTYIREDIYKRNDIIPLATLISLVDNYFTNEFHWLLHYGFTPWVSLSTSTTLFTLFNYRQGRAIFVSYE